jgi:hypothetical protein
MTSLHINTNAPEINLSTSALLADLSISVWSARKKDKEASEEVVRDKNAARGAANVNKALLQCESLVAVQKMAGAIRTTHYNMTLPWADCGLRLLTQAKLLQYEQTMAQLQAEFFNLVDNFLDDYSWEINDAQAKLGDLFRAEDYPQAHKVKDKFRFSITYFPIADTNDFRVANGLEAQRRYKEFYDRALGDAMGHVWSRCRDALSAMSERLDYADDGTKKIFRDSLVDNALAIVDLMRDCNITGDPVMEETRARLERTLMGITPGDLRQYNDVRHSVKKSVDSLLAQLPSLDM